MCERAPAPCELVLERIPVFFKGDSDQWCVALTVFIVEPETDVHLISSCCLINMIMKMMPNVCYIHILTSVTGTNQIARPHSVWNWRLISWLDFIFCCPWKAISPSLYFTLSTFLCCGIPLPPSSPLYAHSLSPSLLVVELFTWLAPQFE